MIGITFYIGLFFHRLNRYLLKTYYAIEDCARCEDCGRNVHDFHVPDELWLDVYGSFSGVLCYDCFCDRADRKLRTKWRIDWEKGVWIRFPKGENKCLKM